MVDRFGGLPVATALRGSGLQTKLAKVTVFQAHLVLEGLVLMVVMLGGGTQNATILQRPNHPQKKHAQLPLPNNKKQCAAQKIC